MHDIEIQESRQRQDEAFARLNAAIDRIGKTSPETMTAKELAADIELQLIQSMAGFGFAEFDGRAVNLDGFLRFAANNLATAYAGRVVKE